MFQQSWCYLYPFFLLCQLYQLFISNVLFSTYLFIYQNRGLLCCVSQAGLVLVRVSFQIINNRITVVCHHTELQFLLFIDFQYYYLFLVNYICFNYFFLFLFFICCFYYFCFFKDSSQNESAAFLTLSLPGLILNLYISIYSGENYCCESNCMNWLTCVRIY